MFLPGFVSSLTNVFQLLQTSCFRSPRAIPEIINLGFDWNGSENPGAELDVQKGRSNVSAVEALTAVEGNEQTTSSSPRRQVKRTLGGTGDEQIQNTHYNGVFSHRDFFLTIVCPLNLQHK